MPLEGFKPTIPVFKRAKTFHALNRVATVAGQIYLYLYSQCTQKTCKFKFRGNHNANVRSEEIKE
jgi:hypothetical protein